MARSRTAAAITALGAVGALTGSPARADDAPFEVGARPAWLALGGIQTGGTVAAGDRGAMLGADLLVAVSDPPSPRCAMKLIVNGRPCEVAVPPDTPLLWVLREELGLCGTKYGCGRALCGACTVHVAGQPKRSCVLPVGDVGDQPVVTIEGLAGDQGGDELHAIQQAWLEDSVAQCGYCQAGQIMSAVALLRTTPRPSDDDIDAVMSSNLCRCGTYPRIRRAIHRAAAVAGGRR